MKILSYNVRGLGSTVKKKEIQEIVRVQKVDFCCIQETKLEIVSELMCKETWGNGSFGWAFKESEGRSGGLLSIWNSEVFSALSSWHMTGAIVVNGLWGRERIHCCVINVYSPCEIAEKEELWDRLHNVVIQNSSSCICIIGDFNSIRRISERNGRSVNFNNRDVAGFDNFIRDSGLIDLPLHGRRFTWYRPNGSCTSRLDRALVSSLWMSRWPNAYQLGLKRTISDHCPIVLGIKVSDWGPKPFRCLNAWFSHPNFKDFIKRKWESYSVDGWGGFILKEKFKLLKHDLKSWNQQVFGVLEDNIQRHKNEISRLDTIDEVFGLEEDEIVERNAEMAALFRDLKWKNSLQVQKSRYRWLKEGDLNSKLFHNFINRRRKRNEIVGVNIDGHWLEEVNDVKRGVFEYFRNHFKREEMHRPTLSHNFTDKTISELDNEFLISPFLEDEVRDALWSCDGSKSPGPDGFNFRFLREAWHLFKSDFMRMMEDFYQHVRLVRGLNPSFIVLIPKKETAQGLGDYRPISLIGGVYKIVSKVLARRLSCVLESIISVNQSAFIGGRQILDSVVVLNEAIDEARKRRMGRIFFKIDFAKAYDSVDWRYIDMMMERFNFHPKWRSWIMECVRTASASVLVNGSPSGEFNLERGLRQGDPLSPFLFLIAAEVLSILMSKATDRGLFGAAKIGTSRVSVSHLQFADDTIIMGEATVENTRVMKRVLRIMELISGLKINFDKCSLIGVNVEESILSEMANVLNCKLEKTPFVYLGIRVGVHQGEAAEWGYVVQKIRNRLKRWEDTKLSFGGRITLLNSVLSSLPIYYLSFYKIPKKTLREIV